MQRASRSRDARFAFLPVEFGPVASSRNSSFDVVYNAKSRVQKELRENCVSQGSFLTGF